MRNSFSCMKDLIGLCFLTASFAAAYPNGSRIPNGNAGEPNTGTPCSSCHKVALNPDGGSVSLTLPGGNAFAAGATQRWIVSVADSHSNYKKGFQLTATAGTFTAVSSTVVNSGSSRQYVSHSTPASTFTFDWTAPSTTDTVTVYLAGVAANGKSQTNVYTRTFTLTKAASKPTIAADGVVNAASFAAGISTGAWVTILGSNLAPPGVARAWTSAEIVDGKLPVSLEGTEVRINGKNAAIAYVSEHQLNVQAPEDTALGSVAVDVTTVSGGTSDPVTANLAAGAPGLFRFSPNSYRNVAAVHADGTYAGPSGLFGDKAMAKPAEPGESVLLFGTGFGATDPQVTPGFAYSGVAPLASGNNLKIWIGGVRAAVQFAGLVAPGLTQFNVVVPTLSDGEHLVEVSVWGVDVPTTQYLAVKQ